MSGDRGAVHWNHRLLAALAVGAAVAALLVTLDEDFLRYPGWLAAQKADFILGPVLVGLYWLRVRPASGFGWLLVGFGFLCAGYITQSQANPWSFGIGLVWESVIYLGTLILILTFPTGRLDGTAAKVVLLGGVANAALNVWLIVMLPQTGAGGSISSCRQACPRNALGLVPNLSRALDLLKPFQIGVIVVSAATGALLLWRIATGTPPQRRALAIGTSVALLFLALQIMFLSLSLFSVNAPELRRVIQWAFTGARAAVWYGFFLALIAAQLFAGRTLQRLVRSSLRRPSQRELESMLREPLGDPSLRLRFRDPTSGAWDGVLEPGPHGAVTIIDRNGTPSVALIHDNQLNDDPELLQAAGAIALLAAENAELDGEWHRALDDLRRSRARLGQAVDGERRRLAGNLHDGVQQRLSSLRLRTAMTAEFAADEEVRSRLEQVGDGIEDAIDEVREISQRLYPRLLIDRGLVAALEHIIAPLLIGVRHNEIGRHSAELESAIYYCCLEAVQNGTKHGGPGVTISVTLREDGDGLSFDVEDDGPGFDPSAHSDGMGLQNLRDRLGSLEGELFITSSPGRTVVSGVVPLQPTNAPTEFRAHAGPVRPDP
ncbi:MAG TPA: histidine kinase [Gaiellaceae bacterium]|jgi:signal transduction histidine kinase